MKLFTAALLLVSLVFLAHGGEALYHAATNRQPVIVTCDQFVRQRPNALWLRVTGCDADYLGAGYRESKGGLNELFLPMRPPSQSPTSPVALVVATNDPQVLAIAGTTVGNNQQPDQDAYAAMMRRIVTMLRASKEVEGYARQRRHRAAADPSRAGRPHGAPRTGFRRPRSPREALVGQASHRSGGSDWS